ncbi:hypothetical protein CVD28_00290 [Bacillus sp. M6-12]|uniref:hypothetical protein n=1 Tax=Bacillus sp. M6-12 TaxID=2054166 RepID=UPI000C7876B4|nr:hypothetical protein [Bacillus sp. M6-12]PLS18874.1 hypothetical protein CVD28_00290 [Bacillus sp. M6-12]
MADSPIISFTDDQKEVCIKTLKDTYFAVKQLHDLISVDKLNESMRETIPQLVEYHMAEISKIIGFDSASAKKVEEKHAEIRKANETIRELEKKIASNNPIEGLKEQLEHYASLFQRWWRADGFGYVKEMRFTQYGRFEAELGISFHRSSIFSKKPASERQSKKEWLESLKEQGYKIYENERGGDKELIDCPENKELLINLIEQRFPSAFIEGWRNQRIYEAEGHVYEIHEFKVDISDLQDLKALERYFESEGEEEF